MRTLRTCLNETGRRDGYCCYLSCSVGAVGIVGVIIPTVANTLARRNERRRRYMELREEAYLEQIEWFKVLNSAINLHIGYHKGKEAPNTALKILEQQASLTEGRYKLSARMSLYASDEAAALFDAMEQLISSWFREVLPSDNPNKSKSLEVTGMAIFEFEQELISRLRREISEFDAVAIGRKRIRLIGWRSGAPSDQAVLVLQRVLKRVDEELERGAEQGSDVSTRVQTAGEQGDPPTSG
jgi:hypothetical protein